jgi:hypothetical protein
VLRSDLGVYVHAPTVTSKLFKGTKFANFSGSYRCLFFLKPWYVDLPSRYSFLFDNWYCLARIIDKAYKSYYQKKEEDKLKTIAYWKLKNLKMDVK